MRENAVREQVQAKFIDVNHIEVRLNPSDIFTKEDRYVSHFTACTDVLLSDPPSMNKPHNNSIIINEQGVFGSVREVSEVSFLGLGVPLLSF